MSALDFFCDNAQNWLILNGYCDNLFKIILQNSLIDGILIYSDN